MTFADLLCKHSPTVMDAAMGTRLLPLNLCCCEIANLSHAGSVAAVHRGHAKAGAKILLTNTFQANPVALAAHRLDDHLESIISRAISIARTSGGNFVLGSVGPIYSPGRSEEFADRVALSRTLQAFANVDGILFETCSTPAVLTAVEYATHRIEEIDGLPILVSFSFLKDPNGRLCVRSGHTPETLARHARRHHVSALGVNCGRELSLADHVQIVRAYRSATDLPILVRPNAGSPGSEPIPPERFAQYVPAFIEAGASLIGGCCGTTDEHIVAMVRRLQNSLLPRKADRPGSRKVRDTRLEPG